MLNQKEKKIGQFQHVLALCVSLFSFSFLFNADSIEGTCCLKFLCEICVKCTFAYVGVWPFWGNPVWDLREMYICLCWGLTILRWSHVRLVWNTRLLMLGFDHSEVILCETCVKYMFAYVGVWPFWGDPVWFTWHYNPITNILIFIYVSLPLSLSSKQNVSTSIPISRRKRGVDDPG